MAYYCLHELHMIPSDFFKLDRKERAFIVAAIEYRTEQEKKKQKQMNRKRPRGR